MAAIIVFVALGALTAYFLPSLLSRSKEPQDSWVSAMTAELPVFFPALGRAESASIASIFMKRLANDPDRLKSVTKIQMEFKRRGLDKLAGQDFDDAKLSKADVIVARELQNAYCGYVDILRFAWPANHQDMLEEYTDDELRAVMYGLWNRVKARLG